MLFLTYFFDLIVYKNITTIAILSGGWCFLMAFMIYVYGYHKLFGRSYQYCLNRRINPNHDLEKPFDANNQH